jgi:hypothetical protein
MRLLKADYLARRCGSSLDEVVCCNVGDLGLESFGEALKNCTRLEALRAQNNKLKTTEGLVECRNLWVLDLSNNRIGSLQGLFSFKGLGYLNLCGNKLGFDALRCLESVHILELDLLAGNPLLCKDLATKAYRQKVIRMLPLVWVLDGQFISVEEATAAREVASEPLPSTTTPDGQLWKGFASWDGVQTTGDSAMELLAVASETPSKPSLVDRYKLKQLSQMYTRQCFRERLYAQRLPGFFSRTAMTAQNGPRAYLHTEDVTLLSPRQMLDLCIMLCSLIYFPGMISSQIVEESLSILISNPWPKTTFQDLACLPPFALTINAFFLHECLRDAFQEGQMDHEHHNMGSMSSFDRDLWQSIPRVCTRYSGPSLSKQDMDTASTLRFRHSVILFSRSPNFPPLVKSQRTPQMEVRYNKLFPLMECAGMGESDLKPTATYRNDVYGEASDFAPPDYESMEGYGAQEDRGVSGHSQEEYATQTYGAGYDAPENSMMDTIVDEHDRSVYGHNDHNYLEQDFVHMSMVRDQPSPHSDENVETFAGYSGLRKPRDGECVEITTNVFTRVAEVNTENPSHCIVTLHPFKGFERSPLYGHLYISSSDLFIGSNGAWKYVHGFRQGQQIHNEGNRGKQKLLKHIKLHRTNKGLNRTGLKNNTGVPNGDLAMTQEIIPDGNTRKICVHPFCLYFTNTCSV